MLQSTLEMVKLFMRAHQDLELKYPNTITVHHVQQEDLFIRNEFDKIKRK